MENVSRDGIERVSWRKAVAPGWEIENASVGPGVVWDSGSCGWCEGREVRGARGGRGHWGGWGCGGGGEMVTNFCRGRVKS